MTSQETGQSGDPGLGLSVRWEDDTALVLSGELDLATAHILQAALDRHGGDGDLTLDLAGLGFMDSTGIKIIITAARMLEGRGLLTLRSPAPPIRRVLELVQIDRVPGVKVEHLE
ncbi:MAG TPA: STAS domain-containing protein [Actinomycetota bacterium]|jgi:anti-anti-sigma factor